MSSMPRLFVIIVHVVNIVRNNGETEPQERRNQTAMAGKPKRNNGENEPQERRKRTARAEETNRNGGKNEPPVNIMKPLTITHIIR